MRASALCGVLLAAWAGASIVGGGAGRPESHPCTAPPVPGGVSRSVTEGHARPSSFAPHARSRSHAYGAPIPRPIVSKHAPGKHRAVSSPASSR